MNRRLPLPVFLVAAPGLVVLYAKHWLPDGQKLPERHRPGVMPIWYQLAIPFTVNPVLVTCRDIRPRLI